MAGKSFQAQVDTIIVNSTKRLELVQKQSIINAINEMQTPVAKGGKMRVDTGFLRASGQASLNGMPSGQNRRPPELKKGELDWSAVQTEANIGQMQLGSSIWFGWTANYAKYREAYDGFMSSVLQKWQNIVDDAVAEAKRRFG